MSDIVKKFSWGYSAMIPYNETAERLGLAAYVRIENYQFTQKMAENLEAENTRLKSEVERLTDENVTLRMERMQDETGKRITYADYSRLKTEVERLDNLVRYWSEKYQNENARFLRASERIAAKEGKPSV